MLLLLVILTISNLSLANKTNVELIYSSANEDTLTFLNNLSAEKIKIFTNYINWDLQLYTTYTPKPNERGVRDYIFSSDHGEEEVIGNKYHQCAKKLIIDNRDLILFIKCYTENTKVKSDKTVMLPDIRVCTKNNILINDFKNCTEGDEVIKRLVTSTSNIRKKKLDIKIPMLFVNDTYQPNWNGNFNEFKEAICMIIEVEPIGYVSGICHSATSCIYYNNGILLSLVIFIIAPKIYRLHF